MLDRDGTIVPATLLRPRAPASPLPGWVVMHGITRAGRGHAQLVRFARAIASTGAVVIIPEVPEWRRLDLAPHLTAPTIRSAIDALRKTPDVHEGPFGLVGFSFDAPHTVAAAGDPRLRADIAGAVSFGGYCDLGRTIHFMMTGQHEHDGHEISLRPDPYGRWIVAANYLTDAAGYEDAVDVADALRRLAALAGDTGAPAWSPQYDRAKVPDGRGARARLSRAIRPDRAALEPRTGCRAGSRDRGTTHRRRKASAATNGSRTVTVQGRVPGPHPSWAIRPPHPILGGTSAARGVAPPNERPRNRYAAFRALGAGSVSVSASSAARGSAPIHRAGSDLRHDVAALALASQHVSDGMPHLCLFVVGRALDQLARVWRSDAEKRAVRDDAHVGSRP